MARRRRQRTSAPIDLGPPFTEEEDAALIDMARCGLSIEFYHLGLPNRPLGAILDRRFVLKSAGTLKLARLI